MGRALILSDRTERLEVKDRQLRAFMRDSTDLQQAPCEDLDVIVLDSLKSIALDTHVLEELARSRCIMLSTDRAHLPGGLFIPFSTNMDHGAVTHAQCHMSLPRKKRAWKQIVQQKIANQAALLAPQSKERTRLIALGQSVRSGDAGNAEAQAARTYWAAILPAGLRRTPRTRTGTNAALDYGYAVLRACVARACVTIGLHLGLPLFHSNRTNPFALVDDLIEPWRPVVDRRAIGLHLAADATLSSDHKRELVGALHEAVQCANASGPVAEAAERMASSVKRYVLGTVDALDLPTLLDVQRAK